jgi:hypothetical protein
VRLFNLHLYKQSECLWLNISNKREIFILVLYLELIQEFKYEINRCLCSFSKSV